MIEYSDTRRLILVALCVAAFPLGAQAAGNLDRLRDHALDLVNEARSEAGLSDLLPGPVLNDAAQSHATDMADRDFYAHVTPDDRTPRDRFRSAGGSRWALNGENIARCSGCTPPSDIARVEAFQDGWMQSPGHRENILSAEFDRFGFGIAGEAGDIYAVQTFAGPGQESTTKALDAGEARAVALDEINIRRSSVGLAPLKASDPLDTVAKRVLDARLSGGDLPESLFGLLPEGASGWTSLAVRSASSGGSGGALTKGDIADIVERWAANDADETLGGARVGDMGFAAVARDDGRMTAVVLFGGRD